MKDLSRTNPEYLMNQLISNSFPEVFKNYEEDDLECKLAVYINELIDKDFDKLINLLYRIDISEDKLTKALKAEDKTQSSGNTIAKLIIERQLNKLKIREQICKKKINE